MRASPILTSLACLVATACSGDNHPSGPVAAETALSRYDSCAALEADLKQMLIEDIETHFDMERSGRYPIDFAAAEDGPPRASGGRQEGVDYSGTNNQEQGVDEADFVKTDGYHIYLLNGNRLHIFGVPVFGNLVPEGIIDIEGWPREMLLDKQSGRLAVFSSVYVQNLPVEHPLRARVVSSGVGDALAYRVWALTKITIVDASDRNAPRLARELYLESEYQTARMVDRSARVGGYSYLNVPSVDRWLWWYGYGEQVTTREQREAAAKAAVGKLTLADLVPQIYERLPDRTFGARTLLADDCRSFHRPSDSHGRGVASLFTFGDLSAPTLALDADHVISNWAKLYASTDFIYIAEPANDWWWFWWNSDREDVTNVHAFDISTPGETRYVGSGRVDGAVNDQFSMDEKDGVFRVVTTTDQSIRWWVPDDERPQSKNHVFTLRLEDGRLKKVGHLGGLAPGERVWSTRFTGDRAFVVTFRNIDPLFVIDVEDPAAPKVLGELKMPGVSTYMQEIAPGRLLAAGYAGDDDGLDWRPQVSLFDVSDDEHPALLDVERLGPAGPNSWSWSQALNEHKAFQYWGPEKLLAVPVSSYRSDIRGYSWSSALELISVSDGGLASYGRIDHSQYYNRDPYRFWIYADVRRSIFMGDFVYAVSDAGISVHALDDLSMVTDALLPGYDPTDYYWWW